MMGVLNPSWLEEQLAQKNIKAVNKKNLLFIFNYYRVQVVDPAAACFVVDDFAEAFAEAACFADDFANYPAEVLFVAACFAVAVVGFPAVLFAVALFVADL